MNRWTNVAIAPTTRTHTAPRVRASDYPPGPYPWTGEQGRACFEAHAWGGGASLANALLMAHREDRPPCWPPTHVVDAETALLVLLNKAARVKRLRMERMMREVHA